MHWRLALAAVAIPAAAAIALPAAACGKGERQVFACMTKSAGQVEVCEAAALLRMRLGRAGLVKARVFDVPKSQAELFASSGVGRNATYVLTLPNAGSKYAVSFSLDRLTRGGDVQADVSIEDAAGHNVQHACQIRTLKQQLDQLTLPVKDEN